MDQCAWPDCRKNGYENLLAELKLAVDANNEIIGHILKDVDNVFENLAHESRGMLLDSLDPIAMG